MVTRDADVDGDSAGTTDAEQKGTSEVSASTFAVSPAQREKVAEQACAVCWRGPCDPAHLIPRSLVSDRAGEPIRIIPWCRECHRLYDTGELDLLPHLRPWRREVAHAAAIHPGGILGALERISNLRWVPEEALIQRDLRRGGA
jgi:hypothetical protein